jgi:hypothetical protein
MTPAVTVTPAERLAETLHRLGYLIDRHHLPAPEEMRVRTTTAPGGVRADVRVADLHELNKWATVSHATITQVPKSYDGLHVACTVLGDVPLRMTCLTVGERK